MKVGDNLAQNLQFFNNGREWDQVELVNAISRKQIVWCWGAQAWTTISKFALRFKVNGHLHKGHVYLAVNASDLYDIYLTTIRGKVVKIIKDVYIENLIETIDGSVEKRTK
jgi:hypothetical protein